MVAESSSEDEGPSGFDLDLGAFELVDSGLSAETLLSAEEPVSTKCQYNKWITLPKFDL